MWDHLTHPKWPRTNHKTPASTATKHTTTLIVAVADDDCVGSDTDRALDTSTSFSSIAALQARRVNNLRFPLLQMFLEQLTWTLENAESCPLHIQRRLRCRRCNPRGAPGYGHRDRRRRGRCAPCGCHFPARSSPHCSPSGWRLQELEESFNGSLKRASRPGGGCPRGKASAAPGRAAGASYIWTAAIGCRSRHMGYPVTTLEVAILDNGDGDARPKEKAPPAGASGASCGSRELSHQTHDTHLAYAPPINRP